MREEEFSNIMLRDSRRVSRSHRRWPGYCGEGQSFFRVTRDSCPSLFVPIPGLDHRLHLPVFLVVLFLPLYHLPLKQFGHLGFSLCSPPLPPRARFPCLFQPAFRIHIHPDAPVYVIQSMRHLISNEALLFPQHPLDRFQVLPHHLLDLILLSPICRILPGIHVIDVVLVGSFGCRRAFV